MLCLCYNSQDRTGRKDQCLNQRFLNSFSQKGEFFSEGGLSGARRGNFEKEFGKKG